MATGNFFGGQFFGGGFFGEITPTVANTGGGALWAKGRGKLKLRRPLTYSETEELRERLQAIAAQKVVAIPMDRISDEDGHVIGDDPFEDDDMLLKAVVLRLLH